MVEGAKKHWKVQDSGKLYLTALVSVDRPSILDIMHVCPDVPIFVPQSRKGKYTSSQSARLNYRICVNDT